MNTDSDRDFAGNAADVREAVRLRGQDEKGVEVSAAKLAIPDLVPAGQ